MKNALLFNAAMCRAGKKGENLINVGPHST